MKPQKKTLKHLSSKPYWDQIEALHPYKTLAMLFIVASAIVFTFLIVMMEFERIQILDEISLRSPRFFALSTIIILPSCFVMSQSTRFFDSDQLLKLKNYMGVALIGGLVFVISQMMAWMELINNLNYTSYLDLKNYFFIISGLHLAHLAGALVYCAVLMHRISILEDDAVQSLIYMTNPYQKTKYKTLTYFWYYLGIAWLVIFIYFLFAY